MYFAKWKHNYNFRIMNIYNYNFRKHNTTLDMYIILLWIMKNTNLACMYFAKWKHNYNFLCFENYYYSIVCTTNILKIAPTDTTIEEFFFHLYGGIASDLEITQKS